MKYIIAAADLYYQTNKVILIEAENKIEAIMEAACFINKGETLKGEKQKLSSFTLKGLKEYLLNYWEILISDPVETE